MLYIYGRCKKMTFRMGAESQHNVIKKVEMRGSMDKGWTALTKEMESELITDARKNESRITTWRERQIYLVDLAKKALVHKLGHYLPEDSEEDKVKISDRFWRNTTIADLHRKRKSARICFRGHVMCCGSIENIQGLKSVCVTGDAHYILM